MNSALEVERMRVSALEIRKDQGTETVFRVEADFDGGGSMMIVTDAGSPAECGKLLRQFFLNRAAQYEWLRMPPIRFSEDDWCCFVSEKLVNLTRQRPLTKDERAEFFVWLADK